MQPLTLGISTKPQPWLLSSLAGFSAASNVSLGLSTGGAADLSVQAAADLGDLLGGGEGSKTSNPKHKHGLASKSSQQSQTIGARLYSLQR